MEATSVSFDSLAQESYSWSCRGESHVAKRFHDALVVKHALDRWKAAQTRNRVRLVPLSPDRSWLTSAQLRERRAIKHVARRDIVLVGAMMHIWQTQERCKLLTRVRSLRVLKYAWAVWKRRMEEQKERDGQRSVVGTGVLADSICLELAQLFRSRSSSLAAAFALARWRHVLQSHQNAQAYAVHYHSMHLQYKMLRVWRLQLRAKLHLVKQAKTARRQLLMRRFLRAWASKAEEKKRLRKLKQFELRTTKKYFEGKCLHLSE